jgi:hypothetical protein
LYYCICYRLVAELPVMYLLSTYAEFNTTHFSAVKKCT